MYGMNYLSAVFFADFSEPSGCNAKKTWTSKHPKRFSLLVLSRKNRGLTCQNDLLSPSHSQVNCFSVKFRRAFLWSKLSEHSVVACKRGPSLETYELGSLPHRGCNRHHQDFLIYIFSSESSKTFSFNGFVGGGEGVNPTYEQVKLIDHLPQVAVGKHEKHHWNQQTNCHDHLRTYSSRLIKSP